MAHQNTDLGWEAESSWLKEPSGLIAVFSSVEGLCPVAGGCTDRPSARYNGTRIWYRPDNSYTRNYGTQNADSVYVAYTTDSNSVHIFSIEPSTTVYAPLFYPNQQSTYGQNYTTGSSTWQGTGLYHTSEGGALDTNRVLDPDIPVYANNEEMIAAIRITQIPYYKLNPGFAVACILRWRVSANIVTSCPFLISSVPENVVISSDGTDPTYPDPKGSFLRDGIRFYINYVPQPDRPLLAYLSEYADLSDELITTDPEILFNAIATLSEITVINPPDPYGDTAGEDGGEHTDPDDEPVEEETLPLPSVAGLGFCTIYVPTESDLLRLSQYLWGGNLDLDTFLKLFANPMDSILGLSAVPVSLVGTYSPVYMGGQILENITLPRFTGRTFIKVNMGTMTIEERWGSYLDYDPYTELSLYLPFIGIKNIKADDVMGKTISLTHSIDILSGACVAYIRTSGGSVLYEWSGQCAMQIPITGQNWDNVFSMAAATAVSLGSALFAPSAISAGAIASTAVQAISAKPRVERSGAVSGLSGFLGQLRPYLIRVIPEAYVPNEQNKFIGYPSFISAPLGSLKGYNEISSIHLEGIPATGNELSEIETLLKGGVIL